MARQPDEKMFPPITEQKPPVEEISETATEQDGDAEMTVRVSDQQRAAHRRQQRRA